MRECNIIITSDLWFSDFKFSIFNDNSKKLFLFPLSSYAWNVDHVYRKLFRLTTQKNKNLLFYLEAAFDYS